MDVLAGLRSFLADSTDIASLVPLARIYSPALEAKAFSSPSTSGPAIQLQNASNVVVGDHNRGPGGLRRDRVQIDCWATTQGAAKAVGNLCRQRLNGYAGTWTGTGSPPPTLDVQGVFLAEGSERFDGTEIKGGLGRHSADYFILYTDSEEQTLI